MTKSESPLWLLRLLMTLHGSLPKDGLENMQIVLVSIHFLNAILFNISLFVEMTLVTNFMDEGLEPFQFVFTAGHTYVKYFNFFVRRKRMIVLFNEIESIWFECVKLENSREILAKGKAKAERQTKLIMVFIGSCLVTTTTNATIVNYVKNERNLPFIMWDPFENLFVKTVTQIILAGITTYCISMFASFFRHVSLIICTIIKIIRLRFIESTPSERPRLINLHQRILKVTTELNKIYSGQIALEILTTSIFTCVRGYFLKKAIEKADSDLIANLYILGTCLLTPYLICSNGSLLSEESDKLFHAIYSSKWYEEGVKSRRTIILMQEMAKTGIVMNYRKLITFDMQRFAGAMQAAYSYLALLQSYDA